MSLTGLLALDNPLPEQFQDGWRGLVLGLLIMGGGLVMFEIGHWAGSIEEREYWAPLGENPQRLWWRGWRWLELHLVDRVRHRVRPAKRAKAPSAVGRHRPVDPDAATTEHPVVTPEDRDMTYYSD